MMMMMKKHEHKWAAIRKGYPQTICKCGELKVGTHTVLLGDLVRYSSTKLTTAAGQLGMDLATGRAQQFVGGANQAIANLSDITGGAFSAGGVITPVGLPLVGDTTLFTITPPAGDYLFTFTTLWEQGGGTNSAVLEVRVNGVALVGYSFAVVLTLVPFREMTFIGKVSLGGADVLSLVSGPALGPGMGMDPGYYSILQVA
jgi:hypothetical protein